MPMFDDPRKELSRLQKVLLEEEEMENPQTEEDWLDDELADIKAWLDMDDEDTADYQKYAKNYREQQAKAAVRADYHDLEEEEDRKAVDDARGQQILTFLLLLGIIAVAAYWVVVLL